MTPARIAKNPEGDIVLPVEYFSDDSLTLPEDMSEKSWAALGVQLGRLNKGIAWWWGAWINYGERRFGERYTQAVEATGLDVQTLINYAWVERQVAVPRRRALSFGHHAEVAALEADDQVGWLGKAEHGDVLPNGERKPWSRARLRQELKALGPPKGTATQTEEVAREDTADHGGGVAPEVPGGGQPEAAAAITQAALDNAAREAAPYSGRPLTILEPGQWVRTKIGGPLYCLIGFFEEPGGILIKAVTSPRVFKVTPGVRAVQPQEQAPEPATLVLEHPPLNGAARAVKKAKPGAKTAVEDWLKELEATGAYTGIDLEAQLKLALRWCERKKNRRATRDWFERVWLARADRDILPPAVGSPDPVGIDLGR